MSQTGYTPIQLYRSSTAAATPSAGNLSDGELAINTTDEKLYFKNASGTVKLLAANITPVENGGTGASTAANARTALDAQQTLVSGTNIKTINSTSLLGSGNITTGDVTTTGAQTLTDKRIDPRVVSAASASSLTPSIATADQYAYTALAANLTINAPTGTPVDGNKLIFRILDNGTSRTLTWNATYTAIGVTLPTATTISKTTYVGCIYNAANTRWDVIAVATQA